MNAGCTSGQTISPRVALPVDRQTLLLETQDDTWQCETGIR